MYAHSHVYLTMRITGSKNPLLIFGSLFPDFHQTHGLPQGFDRQVMEFMQFLKDERPDMLAVAVGMTLHEYPIGVDRFVHQSYKGGPGYAFQFSEQLFDDAKEVFGMDDPTTNLMIHFLVENAIEHKIVVSHPETHKMLKSALESVDKPAFVSAVSEFYHVDSSVVEEEWKWAAHQNLDFDYSDHTGEGKAWVDCMERLFDTTADPVEIGRLIEKTERLIEPTVDEFLEHCVTECKREYEENFPTLSKEFR